MCELASLENWIPVGHGMIAWTLLSGQERDQHVERGEDQVEIPIWVRLSDSEDSQS